MTDIKKGQFIEAFEATAGNISASCKKLNISRETYYRWCREDQEFREKIDETQESLLDLAETMLIKNIREGRTAEIIFFLKTKGKKRGYIERTEIEIEKPNYNLSKFTNEELIALINDTE